LPEDFAKIIEKENKEFENINIDKFVYINTNIEIDLKHNIMQS
jgi:hypothetical protein